jgi:hypothetical protein
MRSVFFALGVIGSSGAFGSYVINHTILDMKTNSNAGHIIQGMPISKDDVAGDLDFFMDTTSGASGSDASISSTEFAKFISEIGPRLACYNGVATNFLQHCKDLFAGGTPQQKEGIFVLLRRVVGELGKGAK